MRRRTYERLKREGMELETRLSKRIHKRFPDHAILVAYTD
jgi:hypothetical protein